MFSAAIISLTLYFLTREKRKLPFEPLPAYKLSTDDDLGIPPPLYHLNGVPHNYTMVNIIPSNDLPPAYDRPHL
jgi:hypothetical protein